MVETVVVVFVALLLLLGIIQFALIYNAKNTLTYATFEAARTGALNYADKRAIDYALARGLAPLYSSVDPADSGFSRVATVQAARDRVFAEVDSTNPGGTVAVPNAGQWACVERLNPAPAHFAGSVHGIPDNTGLFAGQRLIPNDHLRYRSSRAKGAPQVSIQDANLLKLRVTYCYPMYIPIVANTIKWVMGLRAGGATLAGQTQPYPGWVAPAVGPFHSSCYQADQQPGQNYPRIPLVAQAVVRMQTPAKNDTFPASCN